MGRGAIYTFLQQAGNLHTHRVLIGIVWVVMSTGVYGEVPIEEPKLGGNPTGIAPLYFGPNALPVPDMSDGRPSSTLRLEVSGDGYWGKEGDKTADLFARTDIPLFTDRVNLNVWMPVYEWYEMTPERQRTCRLQDTAVIRGAGAGDVYISTDIQVLRAKRYTPDIAIRAGIKTASGGQFGQARHFDDPGYWFDAAIGKSFRFGEESSSGDKPWEMRLSVSGGFLCWQTNSARQNDAVMYGVQLLVRHNLTSQSALSLRTTYGGYIGWEDHGDRPMTLKTQLTGHIRGFEPFVRYQWGIRDYPFHQLRIGLAYNFDILKKREAK